MDKAHRWLSNVAGRFVLAKGGQVIPHPGILFSTLQMFRPDGVHLSMEGSDPFLTDLQRVLRECLVGIGREGC